jgi:hypothetical protein
MAIIVKQNTKSIGYYICFHSDSPENPNLDEVGGFGNEGFKTLNEAIEESKGLVDHAEDIVLYFGCNLDNILLVAKPFGFLSGEDFFSTA